MSIQSPTALIDPHWLAAFVKTFQLCKVQPGDVCAVLVEAGSRRVNVELAQLALAQLGAQVFTIQLSAPKPTTLVAVRSTGASNAIAGLAPVVQALSQAVFVADCTVEGLLHAAELPQILAGGARVLMVSNEHPETLERLVPDDALEPVVKAHIKRLRAAKQMHVSSAAGTDLKIAVTGAPVGGGWGYTSRPGTITHWPGGLCLCFPRAGSVNGQLVMDVGDVNLTFKRYLETRITLRIENDFVTHIGGTGVDAQLMRSYFAAWGDQNAYAVSHCGWGLNPRARWDSMAMVDKNDFNGTELRAFAGNFLYSTGANETAGRHTLGHFDLPHKNCSVALDGDFIVREGELVPLETNSQP
jgi:2,5-dihydroxypyridine 5,6-dioxygenase